MKKPTTSIPSTSVPNPAKVGSTAVKMPKATLKPKMPEMGDKASEFLKKEDFAGVKQASIEKLRTFLEKVRAKK